MDKKQKPKDKWRRIDKEKVQELYMTSPFIEWTKFAESHGWNPYRSRTDFPVSTWQEEKRRLVAQYTAEEIKAAVFKIRGEYQLEIIETLNKLPKLVDEIYGLIRTKIDSIKALPIAKQAAIPSRELLSLAKAVDTVTAAKHRALMLDRVRWAPEVAEAEAVALQAPIAASSVGKAGWRMEVIGGEDLTREQMQEYLARWYDQPSGTSPKDHSLDNF